MYRQETRKNFFQRIGPIKNVLFITLGLSLFTSLFEYLFTHVLHLPSPFSLLSLSLNGTRQFFFWQLFTHLFIPPLNQAFSPSFIIYMIFNLYLLWFAGASLINSRGPRQFHILYFLTGLFSGLTVILFQAATGQSFFYAGNQATIYAILIAWVSLHPQAQVRFFFAVPLQAKWLVAIMLGFSILTDLSSGNLPGVFAMVGASVFTYFYTTLVWNTHSPFTRLHPFEKKLFTLSRMIRNKKRGQSNSYNAKIFDFKTGKEMHGEEAFVNSKNFPHPKN